MLATLVTGLQYLILLMNYLGCSAILVAFRKSRSQKMGKYKYFFLVGASIDLFITFGFTLLELRAAVNPSTAFLTATGWFCCSSLSLVIGLLTIACVIAALILVVYNFMYRFAVQTRFHFLQPLLKPWFFTVLTAIPCITIPQFTGVIYACFGPEFELATIQTFLAERGEDPQQIPAYILYTNSTSFLCQQVLLTETACAVVGSFGVIIFCSICISMELYYWKSNLSAATLRLHRKFLLLLFCQVMSCLAFLCFPVFTAACALIIEFTYSEIFAHFLLVLVNMGGLANSILIISFVPEYRRQIFGLKKRTPVIISVPNSSLK